MIFGLLDVIAIPFNAYNQGCSRNYVINGTGWRRGTVADYSNNPWGSDYK